LEEYGERVVTETQKVLYVWKDTAPPYTSQVEKLSQPRWPRAEITKETVLRIMFQK
jgi:methionyl-tRNA synthetase